MLHSEWSKNINVLKSVTKKCATKACDPPQMQTLTCPNAQNFPCQKPFVVVGSRAMLHTQPDFDSLRDFLPFSSCHPSTPVFIKNFLGDRGRTYRTKTRRKTVRTTNVGAQTFYRTSFPRQDEMMTFCYCHWRCQRVEKRSEFTPHVEKMPNLLGQVINREKLFCSKLAKSNGYEIV